MSKKVALILAGLALLAVYPVPQLATGQIKTAQAQPKTAPSLLFVQTAKKIDYKDGVMTLYDVPQRTMFFTDRPNRVVGNMPTDKFVARWTTDKSPEGFATKPPNAAVSVMQPDGMKVAIVELSNPRLDGNNLSYSAKVLQGIPSAVPGEGAVFIDNWPAWAKDAFHPGQP